MQERKGVETAESRGKIDPRILIIQMSEKLNKHI